MSGIVCCAWPPAPALTAICADPGGEEKSLCPASAQRKDIIYCHRGTRGHGGIQPSATERESTTEREQVPEKDVLCPQQSKKKKQGDFLWVGQSSVCWALPILLYQ